MIRKIVLCLLAALTTVFNAGCGDDAVKKTSPPPSPTPIPPAAERVEKPLNVSFSTYSKDWPVGWQWIDPLEKEQPTRKSVKDGVLAVDIASGRTLTLDNNSAPRYLKPLSGDFDIETRVRFLPKENYQGAGLLIFQDKNNFIRFERAYGGAGGGGEGLRLDIWSASGQQAVVTPNDIQTDAAEVDLRLARVDNKFAAYWRLDEDSEWREVGEIPDDFAETVLTGLIVCNTAHPIKAEFAYIRLHPAAKH